MHKSIRNIVFQPAQPRAPRTEEPRAALRADARPINQPGDEHLSQLICADADCGDYFAGTMSGDPRTDFCSDECAEIALDRASRKELISALKWCAKNLEEVALPLAEEHGRITSLDDCLEKTREVLARA